ncbi:MAG: hypothetical protein GEU96_04860 [Propionibacteriales bacterium]|nr:hypothetical protein [Propionibacteriales bacterium]
MSVQKTVTALATVVASVSLVTGGAVAAQSDTTTGYRGQATMWARYDSANPGDCCTNPATPTTWVHVDGFVRYAKGGEWHARRGTTVHIQKRTSNGNWVTVNKANTGWEPWEVRFEKGFYSDRFTSYIPTASQRVFRLYVPKTDKYQAVYSRPMTARPGCGC